MLLHRELEHRCGVPIHLHAAYTDAYPTDTDTDTDTYRYTDTYADAGAYCYTRPGAYSYARAYTDTGVILYAACSHRRFGECDVGDVGRYYAV